MPHTMYVGPLFGKSILLVCKFDIVGNFNSREAFKLIYVICTLISIDSVPNLSNLYFAFSLL